MKQVRRVGGMRAALLIGAALAVAGCESVKDGITTGLGFLLEDTVLPTAQAVGEETCVASAVIKDQFNALGGGVEKLAADAAVDVLMRAVSSELENPPVYCDQNFVATALLAEDAVTQSLTEMAYGIVAAENALGIRRETEQEAVQNILVLRDVSLTDRIGPDSNRNLTQGLADLTGRAAVIAQRISSEPLTREAKEKLILANNHLYNGAYQRGKAMVGLYVLTTTFSNLDDQAKLAGLQAVGRQAEPEKFLTSMLQILPKTIGSVGESLDLAIAIDDAVDDDEFENALAASRQPDPGKMERLQERASQLRTQTAPLGLPTVGESAPASAGTGFSAASATAPAATGAASQLTTTPQGYSVIPVIEMRYALKNSNLRAGPGTEYDRAGGLKAGDAVRVTGEVAGRQWVRIEKDEGGVAYIYAPLLGKEAP